MAVMSQELDCPAGGAVPFATLGDVNRLGTAFSADPYAPEHLAGVQGYRAFRMQCLTTTLRILDACGPPPQSVVSVRLKRLDSIRRKITRPTTNFKLGTLDDVIGVRVICQTVSDVVALSARIQSSPHIHRVKNYIEAPAQYRVPWHPPHYAVRPDRLGGRVVECSLRNPRQDVPPAPVGCLVGVPRREGEAWSRRRCPPRRAPPGWVGTRLLEEQNNRARAQAELLPYSGARTIAVCWRPPRGPVTPFLFHDDVAASVSWLHYLETALFCPARERASARRGCRPTRILGVRSDSRILFTLELAPWTLAIISLVDLADAICSAQRADALRYCLPNRPLASNGTRTFVQRLLSALAVDPWL